MKTDRTAVSRYETYIETFFTKLLYGGLYPWPQKLLHYVLGTYIPLSVKFETFKNFDIVERLRLRLQICLYFTSISICFNFRLIVFYG